MRLNHLNLTVTDVPSAVAFLEKYMGMSKMGGNAGLTVLSDGGGFVLSLMKKGRNSDLKYPENFHIGFFVESEEKVNEINRRLKEDGFDVGPPQRLHAWTFYVEAPGGFIIEVGA
jgi:lactoylglutathione lyase